jgi:hypothetical protein
MVKGFTVAKINGQDLVIKPVLKSFYCRYCSSVKKCSAKKVHRAGFWVLFKVKFGDQIFYILDGYGETERRTFIHYLPSEVSIKSYITKSGWEQFYPLPFIFEATEELEAVINELIKKEEFQITQDDIVEVMRLFQSNFIRKYHLFDKFNIQDIELSIEFATFYPLLKAYKRKRELTLPYDAKIVEKENSFTSIFELRNIKFTIPKTLRYSVNFVNNFVHIKLKQQEIIYTISEKAVIYHILPFTNCFQIIRYEEDKLEPYIDVIHDIEKPELYDMIFKSCD